MTSASPVRGPWLEATLLDPTCTRADATALLERAMALDCTSVCLPPTMFPLRDVPEGLRLVSVAGYPTGKHHPLVKASEAHMAVVNGAHEAHVVLDPANVVAGDSNAMISEIVTLREAVPYPARLRVAVGQTPVDDAHLEAFCRAAVTAGADVVVVDVVEQIPVAVAAVTGSALSVVYALHDAELPAVDLHAVREAGAVGASMPVELIQE
ncbi:MAG: hypothetical protein ACI38U_15735 [Corynebacterium sp.]|uniref:hypothetical protein n=1 Tax=Corynebacterium sp. TaxID=1720 RepID=UPI003F009D2E